ncbi:WXG100 family type VII secretion target [Streptomyces lavendulae]|uniref:WXG100 family type VII secretion target n=1 Tax=Streptomyces lavendulae TaxID=1914 RepID=UPI0036B0C97F
MATDFEAYSHEQLLAMIASLDSATVVARATQLQGAAVVIKGIGESLRKHQVKGWEGEAADRFQEWVTRAGNATLRLADYSEEGSKWMTHAAQTMVEVKTNTPKYDTSAAADLAAAHTFHNDPDAQQMGRTANSKLNGDRQEAIQQLTKLAQSYDLAATQMNKAEAPTFRPPPPEFEPIVRDGASDMARPGGGPDGGLGAGSSSYPSAASVGGVSSDGLGRSPERRMTPEGASPPSAVPTPVLPDRDVNVGLNHVATLPDGTLTPTTGAPGSGPSIPGGGTTNPVTAVPQLPLPSAAGLKVPGSGPLQSTRPPSGLGGSKTVGLPPWDNGIVGGRQVSPGSPGAGIPRGTVIGGEGAPAAGRGVGNAMGGGLGTPHGPSGGSSVGRRLAVEPGGVVGGRQTAAGSRPVPGGQPFTQGGSGLVRNAGAMGGHAGVGTPVPGRQRGEQGAARPNYLAEDEETWQADRRVVPPVID